jgi:hypothetical protein
VIRLRSFQSIITVLLSVFLLLPGQGMGTVLCIKANGHIALEIAHKGRCATFSEHSTQTLPHTDHSDHSDRCGPCIDVSLSASKNDDQPLLSAPSSLPKPEAPLFVLVPFIVAVHTAFPLRDFHAQPPLLASTLVALRTVVLLL